MEVRRNNNRYARSATIFIYTVSASPYCNAHLRSSHPMSADCFSEECHLFPSSNSSYPILGIASKHTQLRNGRPTTSRLHPCRRNRRRSPSGSWSELILTAAQYANTEVVHFTKSRTTQYKATRRILNTLHQFDTLGHALSQQGFSATAS
jgi:hypothetical protein